MYRTGFWTLWEKARVGCFERTASKHILSRVKQITSPGWIHQTGILKWELSILKELDGGCMYVIITSTFKSAFQNFLSEGIYYNIELGPYNCYILLFPVSIIHFKTIIVLLLNCF